MDLMGDLADQDKKPKRARHQGKVERAAEQTEMRAMWLVQVIQDQIWLYGKWQKLLTMTMERYKISDVTAGKAITRAYEIFRDGVKKWQPDIGPWLTEVHRQSIEMAFKQQDTRAVTGAAVALAKLSGADAADKVHVTGSQDHNITIDERNLVKALKLTNAQRLAEIDKLRGELGVPGSGPVQTAGGGPNVATAQAGPVFSPASPEQPEPEEFTPYPASPTAEEIPEPEPDPQDDELTFNPLPDDEEDDDED